MEKSDIALIALVIGVGALAIWRGRYPGTSGIADFVGLPDTIPERTKFMIRADYPYRKGEPASRNPETPEYFYSTDDSGGTLYYDRSPITRNGAGNPRNFPGFYEHEGRISRCHGSSDIKRR